MRLKSEENPQVPFSPHTFATPVPVSVPPPKKKSKKQRDSARLPSLSPCARRVRDSGPDVTKTFRTRNLRRGNDAVTASRMSHDPGALRSAIYPFASDWRRECARLGCGGDAARGGGVQSGWGEGSVGRVEGGSSGAWI